MIKTNACWTLKLEATCPHCEGDIDLLDDPEFFEANEISWGEHNTEATRNIEIACSSCGEPFVVYLEY